MNDKRLQMILILGLAIAAVVGAVSGAVGGFIFWGPFSSSNFFQPKFSEARVEKNIVELMEEENATIAVVERVTPSVVSIIVKKDDAEISSGSGFFYSADGYVLTNRHVVDELGTSLTVITNNGEELKAELIDTDPFQDVAVLKVDGSEFPIAQLGDSDKIQIGQTVIAIGNTLSEFRNTVTKGVISGINRHVVAGSAVNTDVIEQAIQTDAAINPGNSGGPLINLKGEIIGINTAVSMEGESIAFAIPINQAKRAIEDVREFGHIVRPWLGVRYVLIQKSELTQQNSSFELGALIVEGTQPGQHGVIPGSPAEIAGLKDGDIIVSIDGTRLSQDNSLSKLVSVRRPGETIELEILRNTVLQKISVILVEYKNE
ncbi:trypsin-like peptidase domain-containing protein [Candidatus Uhrbacteria bacterium]|nr:trypsin-like peptidase domain-containing protein [Candidatus Uhrbacteria bacterium]